jgi:hypothetical protein
MTSASLSDIIPEEKGDFAFQFPIADVLTNSALMFADFFFSIIEQLGGKQMVMQLLAHEDSNVRYEALLAVQKLMVHNWFV